MIPGMHTEPVPAALIPGAARFASTFLAEPQAVRIHGPGRLVRLVQIRYHRPEAPGDYWMDADLFQQARLAAIRDLARQNVDPDKRPAYAGMIVRFLLRDQLAICKDWSGLDAFVALTLPAGHAVLALVGQARMQPYYSPQDPAHAGAEAADIRLPGLGLQIVIDFQLPDNRPAAAFVSQPMTF